MPTLTPDQFANFALSTLAGGGSGVGGALASGDTSCAVRAGDGAKFSSSFPYVLLLGNANGAHELVTCTARTGDTLTIVRGQEGTSATAWSLGTSVQQVATAGSWNNLWGALASVNTALAHMQTFNVRDYGAVGDGVTDDTAAIQAAIQAAESYIGANTTGAVVSFPPPSSFYLVSQAGANAYCLLVSSSQLTLSGTGFEHAVQIQLAADFGNGYILQVGSGSANLTNITIKGLTFSGPFNSNTGAITGTTGGILFYAGNSLIRSVNVEFLAGTGLYLDSIGGNTAPVFNLRVVDCQVTLCGLGQFNPGASPAALGYCDQVYLSGGQSDALFSHVTVEGGQARATPAGRYGFYSQAPDARYIGCHAYFCYDGFHSDGTASNTPYPTQAHIGASPGPLALIGGTFETNANANIAIASGQYVTIDGCLCYSASNITAINTAYDILITGGQYFIIANTQCYTAKAAAANVSINTAANPSTFNIANLNIVNSNAGAVNPGLAINGPLNGAITNLYYNHYQAATLKGNRWMVSNCFFFRAGLSEQAGSSYNQFVNNVFQGNGMQAGAGGLGLVSASSVARGNQGVNPLMPLKLHVVPVPTSAAGGSLAASTTYYLVYTYVSLAGESLPSAQVSAATTATNLTINAPSPAHAGTAQWFYVYASTVSGGPYTRQQAVGAPTPMGTTYAMSAYTTSGANPPTTDASSSVTPPALPASGAVLQNLTGADALVCIGSGAVSAIYVNGNLTALTSGAFLLPALANIEVDYSVAPTWNWLAL